ncbi:MAG: hypothetical protein P1U83_11000 [Roseovarius sp.]|nr:hypothetical protein [Roseovarius sp.]
MLNRIQNFIKSEDGAITVDWVVLTVAIIGLSGASAGLINGGVVSASSHIEDSMMAQQVGAVN